MAAPELPVEGEMPSLDGALEWLNSSSLTAAELRGRVVLVDFWTYSCINWIRQLPYVRAWAQKYKGDGLVVIGAHTPEFAFEKDLDNVRRAAQDMAVDYPVAIDSNYGIWRAFGNEYWPALYFIDAQGRVRHHQFGEGHYEQSETIIQQLLTEAGAPNIGQDVVAVSGEGVEAPADWATLGSPETYLGYLRAENLASPNDPVLNSRLPYYAPGRLQLNEWGLSGEWTLEEQFAELNSTDGRIAYRFHARDLHLVMGSPNRETSVRFQVLLDGEPPAAAHGLDVDEKGRGAATQPRLYQLIRQRGPVTEHTFEIAFLDPGIRAYVFTFG
jgi:thiol-disulfide isomerase/thioredoxin